MKKMIVFAFAAALFGAVLLTARPAPAASLMPWSGSQLRYGGNRMPGLHRRFVFDASGGHYDRARPYRSWRRYPNYGRAYRAPYHTDYRTISRR